MSSDRQIRRKIEHAAEPGSPRPNRVWKAILLGACVLAIVVGTPMAISAITKTPGGEPTAEATPSPSVAPESHRPSVQPSPSGAFGTGPQAISNAPSRTYAPVTIPPFANPKVDNANPESVAKTWAYVFHSKDSEDDIQRLRLTDNYVAEQLRTTLVSRSTDSTAPLAGLGASHLESVKFTKNNTQDTPIRWARNAEVTVQTENGPKLVIEYEMQVDATEEGWMLTQAAELGWTEK